MFSVNNRITIYKCPKSFLHIQGGGVGMKKDNQGFTLIELIIVIAVMTVLVL